MPRSSTTPRSLVAKLLVLTTLLCGSAGASQLGAKESPLVLAKSLFPGAEHCDPQVRLINPARAVAISALLPQSVPYHELGERVVYTVCGQFTPLGLLHVGNETGEWGLIEVVWQLNLDMTVRDFKLLRCRELGRKAVESPEFRALLQGKDLSALAQLLGDDGTLNRKAVLLPVKARSLARTLIASALKSIATTQVGWSLTTLKLRMCNVTGIDCSHGQSTTFYSAAQSEEELAVLERSGFGPVDPALRNSLLLAHYHDESNNLAGSIVHLRVSGKHGATPVLFTVADGIITAAKPLTALLNPEDQARVESLIGADSTDLTASNSPFARAALIAVTAAMTDRGRHEEH